MTAPRYLAYYDAAILFLKKMLDTARMAGKIGHEQVAHEARPNPIDALRRLIDAVSSPRRRCFIQYR